VGSDDPAVPDPQFRPVEDETFFEEPEASGGGYDYLVRDWLNLFLGNTDPDVDE
jgi:hypothetical protein